MTGRSPWWQYVGLALLAVVAVGFGALTFTDDPDPVTSSRPTPTPPSETTSAEPAAPDPPDVVATRRLDFAAGDALTGDYATFNSGENAFPIKIRDRRLVHGKPTSDAAAGYLESRLPQDVEHIGATATFPATNGGAIALIAWEESLIAKRTNENTLPRSGLHFVAYAGSWHLGMIDPTGVQLEDIIERGTFAPTDGESTFELYRDDDTAWVVDPAGGVTEVTDLRIEEWAGPWVNWELYEPDATYRPAAFLRVWAG